MQVFHGVRLSQPPRPRVMHEVSAREGSREAFTGETTGWVSSCETGRIPRCRSSSLTRRQHPPRANGLRMEEPRAVGDPMHVETSFVRNLGGLIRVRQGMPDRLMKAKGRTMSMHADEESDEVVLPVKRSDNEGLSSAETVEGRASPKGNGGQTAAARTLRRDTASNGLAAVRRAARQSKTVRFTALLHHITTDLLKQSYLALTRDAAPGTDGVTWQAYGENLEEKLKDLHERVHRGSYRARPASGSTSRRRTAPSGPSAFCVWRTRSSNRQSCTFWKPSTRKIFSASRMDTDRGAANTMRWTLSMPGFIGSK